MAGSSELPVPGQPRPPIIRFSTITVAYSLLKDGSLDEGVVGARASTQYMRCR